ncbi:tRNA-uridine aminocarboxypropyltransferase 2-like isoform X1 [Halichondria panicea]|uniref:tRNA-uridine aminocarboxypropyltransferase 2-like isoform X1 n=1 Tax=Halichondria panicea TaxID=6063 RepID=UPI00312B3E19
MRAPNTYLLFSGVKAIDIHTLPPAGVHGNPPTLIALDGTWSQAKGMYHHNPQLGRLVQVQLGVECASEYVIRTQPTHTSLSTLECVAHALAWLEQSSDMVESLVRPLRGLCQHQLDHGAVVHVSKDHPQYVSRWENKSQELNKEEENNSQTE